MAVYSAPAHSAIISTNSTAVRSIHPLPSAFIIVSPQLKQIGALGDMGAPQVEH